MASQNLVELLRLPRSTANCDLGPEICLLREDLTVRYDVEGHIGPIWTTIRFRATVALRVVPDAAVTEVEASAYSRVCRINNSVWLDSLRSNTGRDGTLNEGLEHFIIFFDHYGAVEVIAKTCELVAGEST